MKERVVTLITPEELERLINEQKNGVIECKKENKESR